MLPHVTQAELNMQPVFHYNASNYAGNDGNNGGGWFSINGNGGGWFSHNNTGNNNGGGNNG